jgi:hypothetical protein
VLQVFRDDALRAELAGMGEDRRAIALEVLAVLDPGRSVGEELGKPALALLERPRAASLVELRPCAKRIIWPWFQNDLE